MAAPLRIPNGHFVFTLVEKEDSHGGKYLFAGLKLFNAVLFVREEPMSSDGIRRFRAELRPYSGPGDANNPDDAVWREDTNGNTKKGQSR